MKVTRAAVFETNSSSTHAIAVKGGEYEAEDFPIDDGICKVHPGEFGWETCQFHDAATKASYCLVYAKTVVAEHDREKHELMLSEVLWEQTGCKVEFVINDLGKDSFGYEWGYIDHQSFDVCAEAFESKESLCDFIFNDKSFLVTDNDNH